MQEKRQPKKRRGLAAKVSAAAFWAGAALCLAAFGAYLLDYDRAGGAMSLACAALLITSLQAAGYDDE